MLEDKEQDHFTYQVDKMQFIVTPVYKEAGEEVHEILKKLILSDLESEKESLHS